jgi:hypothetical protein
MKTLIVFLNIFLPMAVMAQDHHAMMDHGVQMTGLYGSYPMSREASGTAWQPEQTPHQGIDARHGDWMIMAHGFTNAIYDYQQGPRGDKELLSTNMLMIMAQRPLHQGKLGLRGMFSLEPALGSEGYPLLLQTGETRDGKEPLIDRQHPHDLFMELAASYSRPLGENNSIFGYIGLPGEPAIGPPAFMHRFSGIDNPEAPLSHHWLDSTHITFGVLTAGFILNDLKLEGSLFRGREPDESRWDIEALELDSYSGRISYNPGENWSLQISSGCIDSPEQLHPDIDVLRTTASIAYHTGLFSGDWQTMLAWGRNDKKPGIILDAWILESSLVRRPHTFFTRLEWIKKDELFPEGHIYEHSAFNIGKISGGYIYDFLIKDKAAFGIGTVIGVNFVTDRLAAFYGGNHPMSYMGFLRIKV